MNITDTNLLLSRPHSLGGVQRIYRFRDGHGLSVINSPLAHSYPFAWEIAIINGVTDDGRFTEIDYSTPLTQGVEVFQTDAETNEFIAQAASYFNHLKG